MLIELLLLLLNLPVAVILRFSPPIIRRKIRLFFKEFAILYILHHPEVQLRVQEELDQVCGSSLPSLSHRSKYCKYYYY